MFHYKDKLPINMPFYKGHVVSKEEKEKISAGLRRYYLTHPGRSHVMKKGEIHWLTGRKRSEEVKKKISEGMKGKKFSPEHLKNWLNSIKRGRKSPSWKRGFYYDGGYKYIYSPNHPFGKKTNGQTTGYVMEHRLIMEKKIGRFLDPIEVVHHINQVRDDNRLENLILFKNDSEHRKHHIQLKNSAKNNTYQIPC